MSDAANPPRNPSQDPYSHPAFRFTTETQPGRDDDKLIEMERLIGRHVRMSSQVHILTNALLVALKSVPQNNFSRAIDALASLLPPEWTDGRRLISHLNRIRE